MNHNVNIVPVIFILIAVFKKGCLGAVDFVDPPSGSVIANFEGSLNAATLRCNISDQGAQVGTQWAIENLGGNSAIQSLPLDLFEIDGDLRPGSTTITFFNRATVLNFTSDLNNVIVYCGTGTERRQAMFTLRLYRPPNLHNNLLLRIQENQMNIPVDLRQDPTAFPEPTFFNWNKDGQPLRNGLNLTYSNVTFDSIRREDAGNYSVSATNFVLPGSPGTDPVGNDTGSFYLDVIYGPSLALGPPQHYVLLGDSASLVCGTGLDSNPQATITWTDPNGTTIMDSDRFNIENGPDIVRLNLSRTLLSDAGMWRCQIRTESESDEYKVDNNIFVRTNVTMIGSPIQRDIELMIIAPPGQPHTLSVKESDATLFQVCWEPPVQPDSHISYYLLRACNLNSTQAEDDKVTATTISNDTFYSVTGLLPGTTYELTVVAVSQGGDVTAESQASGPIVNTTGVTVPALTCNASANGVVMVTWSYVHTGGLALTNVSMSYTFEDEFIISRPVPVSISSVDTTRITLPNLEAGFTYTFNVTSQNTVGATSALCGLVIKIPLPDPDQPATENSTLISIIGGVVGGLVGLVFIIGFAALLTIICLRRKGKGVITADKAEVVYDYPDGLQLQEYRPKNDGDIKLKECPAYEKPPDIELEECPAYIEKKKDQDFKLEECPAYVEKSKDQDIKLEDCPAYVTAK